MPKMKTVSSAKKRFALTATGKVKRKHAFKSHILTKKTTKQKRPRRKGAGGVAGKAKREDQALTSSTSFSMTRSFRMLIFR